MHSNEERVGAICGNDWYDTTTIASDERQQTKREEAARARLGDGRLAESFTWGASEALRRDAVFIGRVMMATAAAGRGGHPGEVDPGDISAALILIRAARRHLDSLESQVMMIARGQGFSWREVAENLGLMSPQAAAQRWERLTGATAPAVGVLRRRVTSVLSGSGVTRAQAKIWVGGDDGRTVIVQLNANGPAEVRRRVASRIVQALRKSGLDITDEGSHSVDDVTAYIADGGSAQVFDPAERSMAPN